MPCHAMSCYVMSCSMNDCMFSFHRLAVAFVDWLVAVGLLGCVLVPSHPHYDLFHCQYQAQGSMCNVKGLHFREGTDERLLGNDKPRRKWERPRRLQMLSISWCAS